MVGVSFERVTDESDERLAKNESLFRTVNENIAAIAGSLGGETSYEFVCECATASCLERIVLTLREYEQVRADGSHFLMVPGHVDIELEQVIAEHDTLRRGREGRVGGSRRAGRRPARLTRSPDGVWIAPSRDTSNQ